MTLSFEVSYRECYPRVLAYLRRRTDDSVAEDLCAETFTRAWSGWPPRGAHALPWLYGIARNVVLEYYRGRHEAYPLHELKVEPVQEPSAEDYAASGTDLQRAMATLGEGDREILMLCAWEGLSPTEIGAVLGISPNSARVRLHRARARLANLLAESTDNTGARR